MKRYKLIGTQSQWPSFTPGKIYDADYISDYKFTPCTVQKHAEFSPKEWELVEEFLLPTNWCVKSTPENFDIIKKWLIETDPDKSEWRFYSKEDNRYITYKYTHCQYIPEEYTEITFEQFEKYVLNVETNTTMEKQKLIGYKLKEDCEIYRTAALNISETRGNWENSLAKYDIRADQLGYINKLTKAKVLDIWFEPVYKQNFKLPTIGGYKAVDLGDEVKYGCQTYKVEDIKALYKSLSILNIESVKLDVYNINVSIDQILEIVKYFENK